MIVYTWCSQQWFCSKWTKCRWPLNRLLVSRPHKNQHLYHHFVSLFLPFLDLFASSILCFPHCPLHHLFLVIGIINSLHTHVPQWTLHMRTNVCMHQMWIAYYSRTTTAYNASANIICVTWATRTDTHRRQWTLWCFACLSLPPAIASNHHFDAQFSVLYPFVLWREISLEASHQASARKRGKWSLHFYISVIFLVRVYA